MNSASNHNAPSSSPETAPPPTLRVAQVGDVAQSWQSCHLDLGAVDPFLRFNWTKYGYPSNSIAVQFCAGFKSPDQADFAPIAGEPLPRLDWGRFSHYLDPGGNRDRDSYILTIFMGPLLRYARGEPVRLPRGAQDAVEKATDPQQRLDRLATYVFAHEFEHALLVEDKTLSAADQAHYARYEKLAALLSARATGGLPFDDSLRDQITALTSSDAEALQNLLMGPDADDSERLMQELQALAAAVQNLFVNANADSLEQLVQELQDLADDSSPIERECDKYAKSHAADHWVHVTPY